MALSDPNAKFLIDNEKKLKFSGDLLTLGVQSMYVSMESLPADLRAKIGDKELTTETFFKLIGFSTVETSDADYYEGCDRIINLNEPPKEGMKQYSCVLDMGTLEHVFHIPNALKNIISSLKVGGRVIHMLPTNNYVDHGFYMFSPSFFWDYYQANNFTIEQSYILRSTTHEGLETWETFPYFPTKQVLLQEKLDNRAYGTIFVAKKTIDSTIDKIPQQRKYQASWDNNKKKETKQLNLTKVSNVNELKKKVWIFSFNELSNELARLLTAKNYEVLGIVDSIKYNFESSVGKVINANDWLKKGQLGDSSIIFCARSATGEDRNPQALSSLSSAGAFSSVDYVFDQELEQHARLGDAYHELGEQAKTRLKQKKIDPILDLEWVATY